MGILNPFRYHPPFKKKGGHEPSSLDSFFSGTSIYSGTHIDISSPKPCTVLSRQNPESLDEDRAAEILIDANAGRDSYLENAAMATQLCKPKGGKRKVRLGWGLPHHNVQCLGSKLCTLKGWLMNV